MSYEAESGQQIYPERFKHWMGTPYDCGGGTYTTKESDVTCMDCRASIRRHHERETAKARAARPWGQP